ncbi:MAG: hypothetical protein LBP85_04940 [Prevotellaceae bacterium]|jgi:hypothetical protein|nr:hypothetical protein [Prevotellaceae bacterium]
MYNEKYFIKAIELSFEAYKAKGSRSTAKLKPVHKFVADTLAKIWGKDFEICYMGDSTKEKTVEGKYYPKDIDITVLDGEQTVFCLGIKFVTSNYKQNANNYFENMMGETANIQAVGNLPYAQLIILRHETPYYKKNETETPSKIEIVNDKDIAKYLKLMFDNPQAHRPNYLGIHLIDVNKRTINVTLTDLEKSFSKKTA